MAISHLLHDFGERACGAPGPLTAASQEEQRLEAHEAGYRSGWDDAMKKQAEEASRISAEFSQNLLDLSFTYQEASVAVIASLRPVLEQMTATVLPHLAWSSLGAHMNEQLHEIARAHGRPPVEIVTGPANLNALQDLLDHDPMMPVSFVEDPLLSEGRVQIRFGANERQIDLQNVLDGIARNMTDFFEENRRNQNDRGYE